MVTHLVTGVGWTFLPLLSGQVKSEAKTRAARLNGREGGRPKGVAKVFYIARDSNVYYTAFLFDPAGKIAASFRNPHITGTEETLLRPGCSQLKEVRPVRLPFGSIGVVTSKDAWVPDVLDRLATLGADTLCQPEAFDTWALSDSPGRPGDWLPDNFR